MQGAEGKEEMKLRYAIQQLEIKMIQEAMTLFNGHQGKAAKYLDIPRPTLSRKIRRYKLRWLKGLKP